MTARPRPEPQPERERQRKRERPEAPDEILDVVSGPFERRRIAPPPPKP